MLNDFVRAWAVAVGAESARKVAKSFMEQDFWPSLLRSQQNLSQ